MGKFLVIILMAGVTYWPLPFNNGITGSFSEYRFNHIHSGFDFSTKGKTGFPVKCYDDGVVLQVKVFKRGYGNVIYIKHKKTKLISVYGHLEKFSKNIEKIVDNYKKQRKTKYPGVIYLENKNIKFKKNQIIGYSGESGVGFPHFHFELRDLKNNPLNATNLNFKLPKEKNPPIIRILNIIPVDGMSSVKGVCNRLSLKVKKMKKNGNYYFQEIKVNGKIGFSLETFDKTEKGSKLGVAKIEFFVNGKIVYSYFPNKFSFNNYSESSLLFDFSKTSLTPTFYTYNLFKIKGGKLQSMKGSTEFNYFQKGKNKVLIKVYDFNGNNSKLTGNVFYENKNKIKYEKNYLPYYSYLNNKKEIKASDFKYKEYLKMKNGSFITYFDNSGNLINIGDYNLKIVGYNTEKMLINYKLLENYPEFKLKPVENSLIEIGPLDRFIKNINFNYKLKKINKKAGLYRYDNFKNKWYFLKSENKGSEINGSSYKCAIFGIFIDNIAPKITSSLIQLDNKVVIKIDEVGMGVNDENCLLKRGNKMYHLEYDEDRKWLFTEKRLKKGKYVIEVSDYAGNISKTNVIFK